VIEFDNNASYNVNNKAINRNNTCIQGTKLHWFRLNKQNRWLH